MDWSKTKNIVAGADGLEVTFEQGDGTLGAVRLPYMAQYQVVEHTFRVLTCKAYVTKQGMNLIKGVPQCQELGSHFSNTEAKAVENFKKGTYEVPFVVDASGGHVETWHVLERWDRSKKLWVQVLKI